MPTYICFFRQNRQKHSYAYKNVIQEKLENSIFKNTKKAKLHAMQDRKMRLNTVVSGIASDEERIEKLHKMEENFTPDEMSKIFKSRSPEGRNELIKWLMEYDSNKYKDVEIDNIKNLINS